MPSTTVSWLRDTAERAAKTFLQAYLAFWLVTTQTTNTDTAMFDALFTVDNLKAGVVGVALSLASSLGSRAVKSKATASLVQ